MRANASSPGNAGCAAADAPEQTTPAERRIAVLKEDRGMALPRKI
jgi:hypothetical protein